MRRQDREVADFKDIVEILDRCESLTLALWDGESPYALPLNFGYRARDGHVTLFFHGAKDGRKHDLIANCPRAAFSASCSHQYEPAKGTNGCSASYFYESVCGRGTIAYLEGEEAAAALTQIMKKYEPEKEYSFSEKHVNAVRVWKLEVEQLTGKRRDKK